MGNGVVGDGWSIIRDFYYLSSRWAVVARGTARITHILLTRQAEIPYDFNGLVLGLAYPRWPFKIFHLSVARSLFGRPRPSRFGHEASLLKLFSQYVSAPYAALKFGLQLKARTQNAGLVKSISSNAVQISSLVFTCAHCPRYARHSPNGRRPSTRWSLMKKKKR